jgi:hypothetical protein
VEFERAAWLTTNLDDWLLARRAIHLITRRNMFSRKWTASVPLRRAHIQVFMATARLSGGSSSYALWVTANRGSAACVQRFHTWSKSLDYTSSSSGIVGGQQDLR